MASSRKYFELEAAHKVPFSLFADGLEEFPEEALFTPCVYISGLSPVHSTHSKNAFFRRGGGRNVANAKARFVLCA